jgi:hypothetical protein
MDEDHDNRRVSQRFLNIFFFNFIIENVVVFIQKLGWFQ